MLSIVIPVWNLSRDLAAMTKRNINRLWDVARLETEVLVVDNGSPFTEDYRCSVYQRWPSNHGIAPAFNEGIGLAHGTHLCFLNSDCEVEPGWDVELVNAASSGLAIAFPWTNGIKNDGVGVAGWCFVLSKNTQQTVGRFDESFSPAYWEDTDYFYRLHRLGGKLLSVPNAHVRHGRMTTTREAPWGNRAALIHMSNRYRYAWKHDLDPVVPPVFWTTPLPDYPPQSE